MLDGDLGDQEIRSPDQIDRGEAQREFEGVASRRPLEGAAGGKGAQTGSVVLSAGFALRLLGIFPGPRCDLVFEQESRHDDAYFIQEVHRHGHRAL